MGRRRFQSPELRQTEGEKPKWFCRYYKSVRDIAGNERRVEKREYFGFVATVKPLEAKKRHGKFVNDLNRDAFGVVAEATVGEWINEFRTLHYPTLKRSTEALYESTIRIHIEPFFKDVRLADLDRSITQKWMNTLIRKGLAKTTRVTIAGVLMAIVSWAEDEELYDGPNLFRRLNYGPDKQVHEDRIPTWEEFQRILANLNGEAKALALIAASTGLRIGEIVGLRPCDIDFNRQLLTVRQRRYGRDIDVPKSKSGRRDVPFGGLQPLLESLPMGQDLVFPHDVKVYSRALSKAATDAGCHWRGFGWHSLRRLYATGMNEEGANLVDLSRSLGHSKVEMTLKYIKRTGANQDARSQIEAHMVQ